MSETASNIQVGGCAWCDGAHPGLCPFVLEMEYHEHGGIKRVKFIDLTERIAPGAKVEITVPSNGDIGHICGKDCPANT